MPPNVIDKIVGSLPEGDAVAVPVLILGKQPETEGPTSYETGITPAVTTVAALNAELASAGFDTA